MSEVTDLFADSADRLFADYSRSDAVAGPCEFDTNLWRQVQELGFPLLLVAEEQGGIGGSWEDACAVLEAAGRHCAPLPLGEAIIAMHLVSAAGLSLDGGLHTVAANTQGALEQRGVDWFFTGEVKSVPWGRHTDSVVCVLPGDSNLQIVALPADQAEVFQRCNMAGEPRDDLQFDGVAASVSPLSSIVARHLNEHCALLRVAQAAGAMHEALTLTVDYALQRKQFGKAIASFQALQHQLALFGSEAAAISCIARAAARAASAGQPEFALAAAKLRTNRAIGLATATAHQVHGAIGFTEEYTLRRYTQRLWSWRTEYGNDRFWSEKLGLALSKRGADHFWKDLTARDDRAGMIA